MKKIILGLLGLLMINTLYAENGGIGLARGFSGIDGMSGYQLQLQSYWNPLYAFKNGWNFTGYWNSDLSYWQSRATKEPDFQNISILGISPVFRLEKDPTLSESHVVPFVDLGLGIGLMNRNQFSDQKLGGYATLIQTFGAGINFGDAAQYDLAYHYVVYTNGGELRHNDGMFVNAIAFDYHFA